MLYKLNLKYCDLCINLQSSCWFLTLSDKLSWSDEHFLRLSQFVWLLFSSEHFFFFFTCYPCRLLQGYIFAIVRLPGNTVKYYEPAQ